MKNNEIEVKAQDTEKATVYGVAYTGGKMKLPNFDFPIVIDLVGMEIPESIPMLADHENAIASRVGKCSAVVESGQLLIDGVISSKSYIAKRIIDEGKDQEWQLSIGSSVEEKIFVDAEQTIQINGQLFNGPLYVITKSKLKEVSVVAIGADSNTSLQIAAHNIVEVKTNVTGEHSNTQKIDEDKEDEVSAKNEVNIVEKENTMATEAKKTEEVKKEETKASDTTEIKATDTGIEAVRAEYARIEAVKAACEGYPEISAKAISEGKNEIEAKAMILDVIRSREGSNVIVANSSDKADSKVVEAALVQTYGGVRDITAHYDEQVLDAADKMRGIGIKESMQILAASEGKKINTRGNVSEIAAAGFSTISVPQMLGNVANKVLLDEYAQQENIVNKLFEVMSAPDFKQGTAVNLSGVGAMEEVRNGGPIKSGTFSEEYSNYQVKTVAKIIGITREMLQNDDLGGFMRMFRALSVSAFNTLHNTAFARVIANTDDFFHADNGNLIDDALSIDGVSEAVSEMMQQTGIDGQPIMLNAKYLVCPPQLFATAKAIYSSNNLAGGSDDGAGEANVNAGLYEPVGVPQLASAPLAWYLWSNTNKPYGVVYLNGQQSPVVEEVDPGAEYLGRAWRGYFDFGVCELDHRGAVMSSGDGS